MKRSIKTQPWSHYTRWTPERDAELRQLYPEVGATEAARRLGATRNAVKSRVLVLGIRGTFNRPRFWSPEKDAVLRERYKVGAVRALAADLGCSESAIKQRAIKLGLRSGRNYTEHELSTVAALYLTKTLREIAEILWGNADRWQRVFKIAERLKLRKWPSWPAAVLERFRALHARGLSDRQITERMRDVVHPGERGLNQVRSMRKRLSIPPNADPESGRRGSRKQMATMGLDHPTQLRAHAHRRFAAQYGLPEELRPRQVQIILCLISGPLTTAEIMRRCDMRSMTLNRRRLHGTPIPGGTTTYLSDLAERGLATWIATTQGPKNSRQWMLTGYAMELLGQQGVAS